MFESLAKSLFGSSNDRAVKYLHPVITKINDLEDVRRAAARGGAAGPVGCGSAAGSGQQRRGLPAAVGVTEARARARGGLSPL